MASPTTAAGPSDTAPMFTHRQIMVILAGLMAGMFLAALDQTIVATSIRTISDDLQGLDIQAWATTAYLITATISTPLYGKLSDLYGRRFFFLLAITLFVAGSAACGAVQNMYELAACRAFQGLGAGGLFSLALAIIGDIVPPRERARYQGYFLAVFGTSSVLGPVVGGFLAGRETILGIDGWRWVFLVNVPIGAMALALVARVLHLPHTRREHKIDYPGALALTVCVVPLLLVAEQGREWGWGSVASIVCYVLGVGGLAGFLWAENTIGNDALIPLRLFKGRTFSVGSVLNFIIGVGMFGGLACLPLYLQIVKGKSPTQAGLLLLPLTLGIMAGSILSGQFIAKTGRYKIFPIVGLGLLTVSMVLFSRIGDETSLVVIGVFSLLFGLGLGGNMQPLVLAVQNAVPPQDMGVATSSATFFRQMGGTLGTAVFLSLLFSNVGEKIGSAFAKVAPTQAFQDALKDPAVLNDAGNEKILGIIKSAQSGGMSDSSSLSDSSFLNTADPRLAKPFLMGFADAIDLVFILGALVIAIAFVVVFFLPEEPLRNVSGLQARADQKAADAGAVSGTPAGPGSVDGESEQPHETITDGAGAPARLRD